MFQDEPYSNYRLTARLKLLNHPGTFANVAKILAEQEANLGAVDIVKVTSDYIVRDVTFDVRGEDHGAKVLKHLSDQKGIEVISVSDRIFLMHLGGKILTQNKIPIKTRNQLSMAYTPGVARVCKAIAEDPDKVYALTVKRNSVAIISDGSAVLGLGNLGPEAAIPVMEGKAMLFKEYADINAWPICLATQDPDEIVKTIEHIAPVFGGINLEDISAPRCYEIEDRLKKSLSIPVMHDDQHGTAVVVLAGLRNALKIVKKDMQKIRVVVNGVGAAGLATCRILLAAGVKHLWGCNSKGVVLDSGEENLYDARRDLVSLVGSKKPLKKSLRDVLKGADVFIGVSVGNVLTAEDLGTMATDRIVFALANPDPEIDPLKAMGVCRIFATGRSDFPNQINNALVFPGVFRGALDVQASDVNEPMKLAAAKAIADLITPNELCEEYIVPSIFDKRVVKEVAAAVSKAAGESGVARRQQDDKTHVD